MIVLALLIFASIGLSLWLAPRRNRAPGSAMREPDLTGPRSRYLAGEIEAEEFEEQVAEALEHRPEKPVYISHTEIHVYGSPPGHQLHIHLP